MNSDEQKLQNLKMRKKRTTDSAFSEIIAVTTEGNVSAQHSLSMASLGDGKVYFAWIFENAATGRDVYFAKTEDGGRSFTPQKQVDDAEGNMAANNSSIAVDPFGNPSIVWVGGPRGSGVPREIRLVKSTDGGTTFPNIQVTKNSSSSPAFAPNLAPDAVGPPYILWTGDNLRNASFVRGS